ncbi:MAG TPA: transcriptional regulator [Rheinheimera sp.]|nr:transcriptional regulator [Rheinheimera sp.]
MTRAERLLHLMQLLRNRRTPVSAAELADALQMSVRSVYRDIRSLQAQGADIEGEAGLGYILRPGFTLPPLMFSAQELEALALGSRWVQERADSQLSQAATQALAKIAAVLPQEKRTDLEQSALLIGPGQLADCADDTLVALRRAIRLEHKLALTYRDGQGQLTERTVWPVALGFFDQVRVLVAWCELRNQFRHLRADRIEQLLELDVRYPRRRAILLQQWRLDMQIQPTR